MPYDELHERLSEHPSLCKILTLDHILRFLSLSSRLVRDINLIQPTSVSASKQAPEFLPPTIAEFLSQSLELSLEEVQQCWDVFGDIVWALPGVKEQEDIVERLFEEHGHPLGVGELSSCGIGAICSTGFPRSCPVFLPSTSFMHPQHLLSSHPAQEVAG